MQNMKVFRNKITGRLGETQFNDNEGVLIRNAKRNGYPEEEIDIVDMTREEYMDLINKQNYDDASPSKKREIKILREQDLALRDLAIKRLEERGEI